MARESLPGIIFGCVIFFAFILWIVAECIGAARKLKRFVSGLQSKPTQVDQTINQMYGDVHVEPQYAATRNAYQALTRHHHPTKGG